MVQVEPAVGGADWGRSGANLVRKRARASAGPNDRLVVDLPGTGTKILGLTDMDLCIGAADVALAVIVGAEEPDAAPVEAVGEDDHVAHVAIQHGPLAGEATQVVSRRQSDPHSVPHSGVVGAVGDSDRPVDGVEPSVFDTS